MIQRPLTTISAPLLASLALLVSAAQAHATTVTVSPVAEGSAPAATSTTNVPAPSAPQPTTGAGAPTSGTSPAATSTGTSGEVAAGQPSGTATSSTGTSTASEAPTVGPAPEVRAQHSQPRTTLTHTQKSTTTPTRSSVKKQTNKTGTSANAGANAKPVSPSALTPPLPSTLGGGLSNLPSFFINSFAIPPFLLPIYQAAGAAYGIQWQVLAAINEVETDYGRDLSLSSAGAEGWMQFMPSEWSQYGVDVNNSGFEDPYNPADAIFAAARYLKDAGGDTDIRTAVFAYNHSRAYVESVMLRARLLAGTPPELLGAITGLTEARFPVYAASHYSDGFPTTEGSSPHTVAATTIYSQADAPVIAVQDGRIVRIERSGPFGPSVSLLDAYGNTYTYAGLGTLASLYPILESREAGPPRASGLTGVATSTGSANPASSGATRVFAVGHENVYLHPLRVGAQVIAGTVLGHLDTSAEARLIFQIRPAGIGAPLIDPKPILDGWVKLQSSAALKAKGPSLIAAVSPTPGQVLLESKTQLELQIEHDHGVHLAACERRLIADGRADRRVLGALEFLSASGLRPTVSSRGCSAQAATAGPAASATSAAGETVQISAIDGVPVAGPNGPAQLAVAAVHELDGLQGVMKPLQIASSMRFATKAHTVIEPGIAGEIEVAYVPLAAVAAHTASASSSGLNPAQWLQLIARLGEVPDPTVSSKPSPAAIPDHSTAAAEGK